LQTLKIYDLLGNEVATLFNQFAEAGNHEVDFITVDAVRRLVLTSGIYFYQLKAGNYTATKKMILLR